MVRYGKSPIGRVPTQVDYGDYRDVGGIKMPFRMIFGVDGWAGRHSTERNPDQCADRRLKFVPPAGQTLTRAAT